MHTTISRRGLLAAGVTVVGWSLASSSWVTSAEAARPGTFAAVPRLDGTLETGGAGVESYGRDFGRMITRTPMAVLHPGSVRDISSMITFARKHRIPVAMNGQGGSREFESHSNYGQATAPGGIAIDAHGLSTIHEIGAHDAYVDAGVSWAALTDAALAKGKAPAALTDYLRLSVGGTISIGGIGGTVQKHGLQCDTVREIEIVTGDGRLHRASPTREPELFNAALAGGGQVGIIVRARIALVDAPARVWVAHLYYDDLATYRADQEKVLADGRFSDQTGEIVRTADDSGWQYTMQVGYYYTPPQQPDKAALLAGLRDNRSAARTEDRDYRSWAFRADGWEKFLREGGYWDAPKPWLSLVIPASGVDRVVNAVVAELTPADLGGGSALLYPFHRDKITRPLFGMPDTGDEIVYLLDLLRFPEPGAIDVDRQLAQNRKTYDLAVAAGAKRYLVGAVPDMTRADWTRHFGRFWKAFVAAKKTYDPGNILTPGQGFFR